MFYTYIIYSKIADRYYIGMSAAPEDRLKKHRNKSKGFTNIAQDWKIVYLSDSVVQTDGKLKSIKSRGTRTQCLFLSTAHQVQRKKKS
jgi:putative endonuclease